MDLYMYNTILVVLIGISLLLLDRLLSKIPREPNSPPREYPTILSIVGVVVLLTSIPPIIATLIEKGGWLL